MIHLSTRDVGRHVECLYSFPTVDPNELYVDIGGKRLSLLFYSVTFYILLLLAISIIC